MIDSLEQINFLFRLVLLKLTAKVTVTLLFGILEIPSSIFSSVYHAQSHADSAEYKPKLILQRNRKKIEVIDRGSLSLDLIGLEFCEILSPPPVIHDGESNRSRQ